MITQKRLKELLHYNSETGVFTCLVPRGKLKAGDKTGCCFTFAGGKSYVQIGLHHKFYGAHRLAWLYTYGEFPAHEIDHINGDGVDNRLCNLRSVTHSENNKNRRLQSNNTSGVCGVGWNKANRKWIARIKVNSKLEELGSFKDINDAIEARKQAEIKHGFHPNHGEIRPL